MKVAVVAALLLSGSIVAHGFLVAPSRFHTLTFSADPAILAAGLVPKTFPRSLSTLSSSQSDDVDDSNTSEENQETEPTALELLELQSKSFTSEPIQSRRMDPLLASLTRVDSEPSNARKVELPVLGEVSLDGSLFVLIPTVVIAVLGFVMSINIAINSKDDIVEKMAEVNTIMSTQPVARSADIDPNACRGLCGSDQQEQLESLRKYMKGITGRE